MSQLITLFLRIQRSLQSLFSSLRYWVLFLVLLCASNGFSYQVWIGTTCTPKQAAEQPTTWSNVAQQVMGLNINRTPCLPDPGTPNENDVSASNQDYKDIFAAYVNVENGMVPIARSNFDSTNHPTLTLEDVLVQIFANAVTYDYGIGSIMFYDNRIGDPAILYEWTVAEVQEMHDWLSTNGHANVQIIWNARNNGIPNRTWCENPLVDQILLEAEPSKWYDNAGQRQELLQWLTTNTITSAKDYIFQIPVSGTDPYNAQTNGFQNVRQWLHWMGNDLMGWAFNQSDQFIILPVTYNNPTYAFYPETAATNLYTNTLTSLTLSLIEQRDLFEGRSAIPTAADARSMERTWPPVTNSPNLVAHYELESMDGGTAADSAGTNNGTIHGDTSVVPGLFGNAYYFDGTNDYVDLGTATTVQPTNDFTVTCWANGLVENGNVQILGAADGIANGDDGWIVKPQNGGRLFFDLADATGTKTTDYFLEGSGSLPNVVDEWLFMVVRYAKATGTISFTTVELDSGAAAIAAADIERITSTKDGADEASVYYPSVSTAIGALASGAGAFNGIVDDVRFFDGTLSDSDLAALYNDGLNALPTLYDQWVTTYAVTEGRSGDDDHDGLSNIYEYGLGGNPTNGFVDGHLPTFGRSLNGVEYIHAERSAANSSVSYTVKATTNLVSGSWSTNGVELVGSDMLDVEFYSVTNRISTDTENEQFMRLIIE